MSSSDYTNLTKYSKACNVFTTKTASNQTMKQQINTLRCSTSYDVYGQPYPKNWFGVPMDVSNNQDAVIDASINSQYDPYPIVQAIAPLYTVKPYTKKNGN
jgi:hypothetical protein